MYNHPYRRPIIDVKPQQKKPKVPPPKPWIQIANVELYDYDKQALLSPVGWLTDSLVNVAQQLLKKQFSTIQSLQDVAVSYTMNFEIQNGEFIQILHSTENHWVTVSSSGKEEQGVRVFDSLYLTIPTMMKAQIASLLSTPQSQIKVYMMDVQLQASCTCTYID